MEEGPGGMRADLGEKWARIAETAGMDDTEIGNIPDESVFAFATEDMMKDKRKLRTRIKVRLRKFFRRKK